MIIYLIRHTKSDVPPNTCYGQSNISVVEDKFQKELIRLKAVLPTNKWDAVYSSPLKRCLCLAKALGKKPCSIQTDDRLKELNFGKWELKNWDEIDDNEVIEWGKNYIDQSPPEGESYHALYKRTTEFWEELIQKDHDMSAIFTHGGVMKAILTHILEMPLKNSFSFHLHYGEIIKIENNDHQMYQVEFLSSSKNC